MRSLQLVTCMALFCGLALAPAAGQNVLTVATPIQYTATISNNSGTCNQAVAWTDGGGSHNVNPMNWVPLNQTNLDTVTWVVSGSNGLAVTFPTGSAAFPGTPFFDNVGGNWLRAFSTPSGGTSTGPSPVATLTQFEASPSRFQYLQITFGDGSHCSFPTGGMGVQVTK